MMRRFVLGRGLSMRLGALLSFLHVFGCGGSQSSGSTSSDDETPSAHDEEAREREVEAVEEPTVALEVPEDEALPAPPQASAAELALLGRANQFGFDLYAELRSSPGNLVFSPASVQLALGMAYAGARGETARQMGRVLHVGESSAALHRAFGAALGLWNATEAATLEVANRVYVDRSVPLETDFVDLTRDAYLAPARRVDFIEAPEPARLEINRWVEARTRERIRDLLPKGALTPLTRLVLTNAVYFKGSWETKFDPKRTLPRAFWVEGHELAKVATMDVKARFRWAHADGLRVLVMPYAGGELDMVLLLPEARDGLSALEAKLSAKGFERWRAATREVEVEVQLPRFKLEPGTMALARPLSAMGMPLAFEGNADFTGIARLPEGLFIEHVFHKAFLEVNEEGTEAAAATAVVMTTRGMAPRQENEPPRFIADHPFLFALTDRRTGAVLFLGRVVDPR